MTRACRPWIAPRSTCERALLTLRALAVCAALLMAGGAAAQKRGAACPSAEIASARVAHYVCDCAEGAEPGCRPGSDTNPGLSPAAPFRSYERARTAFGSAKPGDMIAFCRGGAFEVGDNTRWFAPACRADRPCVIRDYEPPWHGKQKPELRVKTKGGHALGFEDGGTAQHDEGYLVMGLALRGPGSGSGVFLYNDVDDVMLCDLDVDGFALGVYAAGSNPPVDASSDAKNARITLRNSRITNNSQQGWLGSCEGCAIEYNRFENNGFERDVLLHHIYVSGEGRNERVVGNDLSRNARVNGKCAAAALVVHGRHENLLIENNTIREDRGAVGEGCWGIAVDTGYDKPEQFTQVTIRGNQVVNVGNVGIGVNACKGCLIEDNVVVHEQPFSATLIAVPDRDRAENDAESESVQVKNNALYFGKGATGTGIRLGREGQGHLATGNSVRYRGPRKGRTCFDFDLPKEKYAAMDGNSCAAGKAGRAVAKGSEPSGPPTTLTKSP